MKKLRVAFLLDKSNNWLYDSTKNFIKKSNKKKYAFKIFYKYSNIVNYSIVFALGFTKIINPEIIFIDATNIIKTRIKNITFFSTFRALIKEELLCIHEIE